MPEPEAQSGAGARPEPEADPYAWLTELDAPETVTWMAAQEAVTREILDAVPGRDWLRHVVGRATPMPTVVPPTAPAAWEDKAPPMFAVPSPDGSLVALGRPVGGRHGALIEILDVETGTILPDRPRGTLHESVAWRPDGSSFFYGAGPELGAVPVGEEALWTAIYEHRIGSGQPARRVFGDTEVKEYWCGVEVSECGRFAILTKWDFVHANVVVLLRLADDTLIPVAPEMRSVNRVKVIGDSLLIVTDLDAPRGRCCIASLTDPTVWRTIIAEGPDTLQTVAGIGGRLYAVSSRAASHVVRIHALDGTVLRDLALPGVGSVTHNDGGHLSSGITGSWDRDEVSVSFTSYVQAWSKYRYDFDDDRLTPIEIPDVGLDVDDYLTEQVWYESLDGTPVSMFIIGRKDRPFGGQGPVRLSGYGGFNVSVEPGFTPVNAAWLQMGGVLAYANVRGGGEYGRDWHEAGRGMHRQNAFDDYVAAARWLVASGYTTPARLASRGNSNGGLLVAVTALQAPDAFGAVFSRVPILDMLEFPQFGYLSSTVVEYGSPLDPVEGAYLASYSPYHNVRTDRRYPPMAFVPALDDQTAPPADPLKMVAKLQGDGAQGGPFLLLPLRDSGHAGASERSALIEQQVDELSFYCWALGVAPPEA